MLMKRMPGSSKRGVSAMGSGCWAIDGPFLPDGKPDGRGRSDDAASLRTIQRARDL